jgi:hypothetical protein
MVVGSLGCGQWAATYVFVDLVPSQSDLFVREEFV